MHAQSYPTLCDPVDCRPPGSSVHEIFQTRILEWVAVSSFIQADEEVGEGGWPGDWGRGLEAPGWVRRSLHHSRPVGHAQAVTDEAGNFLT